MILRALIAALGIALCVSAWQTHRLHSTQADLATLQQSIHDAQLQSATRAAISGQEAVTSYDQAQQHDAPVVDRVRTRTLNVCVRQPAADHLSVPGVPRSDQQAAAAAQDAADRAAWLSAVADDLQTCASALNMCRAQFDFHNANVGVAR